LASDSLEEVSAPSDSTTTIRCALGSEPASLAAVATPSYSAVPDRVVSDDSAVRTPPTLDVSGATTRAESENSTRPT
jgi:hypothetical protein